MEFDELLENSISLVKQEKSVSLTYLKKNLNLTEDDVLDIIDELVYAQKLFEIDADIISFKKKENSDTSPHSSLTPERRHLTVMFCSISSTFEEINYSKIDPEDQREVLVTFQEIATEIIESNNGYIAQRLSDGILAYFGYPKAHENDPYHSIRAALEIHSSKEIIESKVSLDYQIDISLKTGIHTGLTVCGDVGNISFSEQLAVGDTPNIAARLQHIASPDEIIVSINTAKNVIGLFEWEKRMPQLIKGISEPILTYRVINTINKDRTGIVKASYNYPCIGREMEKKILLDGWKNLEESSGKIILLSSKAGFGKTRLCNYLEKNIQDSANILVGSCSRYHMNKALFPLANILEQALSISDKYSAEENGERLEKIFDKLGLIDNSYTMILQSILKCPLPAPKAIEENIGLTNIQHKIIEKVLEIFSAIGKNKKTLLVIENLQWADPSTIEFIDYLINNKEETNIYTVITSRDDFKHSWGNKKRFSQIELGPLPVEHRAEMIEKIAGKVVIPGVIKNDIVHRTDGNPLFIEEITKAVIEANEKNPSLFHSVKSFDDLKIPTTLQASLTARLDNAGNAKFTAQIGSVISKSFSHSIISQLSENQEELEANISKLVELEIFEVTENNNEKVYSFKNTLLKDLAYDSLLKEKRKEYHYRIAKIIEKQEGDEFDSETIAFHYSKSDKLNEAIKYFLIAGNDSTKKLHCMEAVNSYRKGLTFLSHLDPGEERNKIELYLQMGLATALSVIRGFASPEVGEAYQRAYKLCRNQKASEGIFETLFGLESYYLIKGYYHVAQSISKKMVRMANKVGKDSLKLKAHTVLGVGQLWSGNLSESLENLQFAKYLIDNDNENNSSKSSERNISVITLTHLALAYLFQGELSKAETSIKEAKETCSEMDNPFIFCFVQTYSAIVNMELKNTKQVLSDTDLLIPIAQKQSFTYWQAQADTLRGWALCASGENEEGLELIKRGVNDFQAIGARVWHTKQFCILVEAYLENKQIDKAWEIINKAITYIKTTKDDLYTPEIYRLYANMCYISDNNDIENINNHFEKAISYAKQQENKLLLLRSIADMVITNYKHDKGELIKNSEDINNIKSILNENLNLGIPEHDFERVKLAQKHISELE